MTPYEKIEIIKEKLLSGKTIYIQAGMGKITKITPANFKKWTKRELEMFKATDSSMYIARGSNWDCIDYCRITMEG